MESEGRRMSSTKRSAVERLIYLSIRTFAYEWMVCMHPSFFSVILMQTDVDNFLLELSKKNVIIK